MIHSLSKRINEPVQSSCLTTYPQTEHLSSSARTADCKKKLHPSLLKNKRIGCSVFAVSSDSFVDLLSRGCRRVRVLPDREMGNHLRMVTSARIRNMKDVKNIFKTFLQERVIRMCTHPNEVLSQCIVVITEEEDTVLRKSGRVKRVGLPVLVMVYSTRDVEEETQAMLTFLQLYNRILDKSIPFVTVLRAMGIRKTKRGQWPKLGILVSHVDLLLDEILQDLGKLGMRSGAFGSIPALLDELKRGKRPHVEPPCPCYISRQKFVNCRDLLISTYELKLKQVKKKIIEKRSAYQEALKDQASKETFYISKELFDELYHRIMGQKFIEDAILIRTVTSVNNLEKLKRKIIEQDLTDRKVANNMLTLLREEKDTINRYIKRTEQLVELEREKMCQDVKKTMKNFLPDCRKTAKIHYHYNYVKTIENIGFQNQEMKDIIRESLEWNEKLCEWVMTRRTKKICKIIMTIVNPNPEKLPMSVMDAFRVYIAWKCYNMQFLRGRKEHCRASYERNTYKLIQKLQLTYLPVFNLYHQLRNNFNLNEDEAEVKSEENNPDLFEEIMMKNVTLSNKVLANYTGFSKKLGTHLVTCLFSYIGNSQLALKSL